MAYLNTKDVYDLFENGVANLHVVDIDALPRVETIPNLNVYKWHAKFDNGATIEDKTGIAFATDTFYVPFIVDNILCKHNEDMVRDLKIEKIEVASGDAFVTTDEWKDKGVN